MTREEFLSRYRLLKRVSEGGVQTYHATDQSGRVVMVHFLEQVAERDNRRRLGYLQELAPADKMKVQELVYVDGMHAVVTDFLQGFSTFDQWLETKAGSTPTMVGPGIPDPRDASGGTSDPRKGGAPGIADQETTMMEAVPPAPPTPRSPQHQPPAAAAQPEADPGSFTQLFGSESEPKEHQPVPDPSPGLSSSEPTPAGDFTQMFQPKDPPRVEAPPPGSATPTSPRTTPPEEASTPPSDGPPAPGEFTQLFGANEPASLPPDPAVDPPPQSVQPEAPASQEGGFTQLFEPQGDAQTGGGPGADAEGVPDKPAAGFTQMFEPGGDIAASPPAPPTPPKQPSEPKAGTPGKRKIQVRWKYDDRDSSGEPDRPKVQYVSKQQEAQPKEPPPEPPLPPSVEKPGQFTQLFGPKSGGGGSGGLKQEPAPFDSVDLSKSVDRPTQDYLRALSSDELPEPDVAAESDSLIPPDPVEPPPAKEGPSEFTQLISGVSPDAPVPPPAPPPPSPPAPLASAMPAVSPPPTPPVPAPGSVAPPAVPAPGLAGGPPPAAPAPGAAGGPAPAAPAPDSKKPPVKVLIIALAVILVLVVLIIVLGVVLGPDAAPPAEATG